MFKSKLIISSIIFISFLIFTSIIKNETRIIEKKISNLNFKILSKEKDINETQLDFYYLSSPSEIEKRLNLIGFKNYKPILYSNIFFEISDFIDMENKITNLQDKNEKKTKKNKNINQKSFYFEDYLETNKKINLLKTLIIFKIEFTYYFFLFSLILIFSIKITHLSLNKKEIFHSQNQLTKFSLERRDIIDRTE